MSIVAKFVLEEIREIEKGDKFPTYVLEAVDDDDSSDSRHFSRRVPKGKIKLRVDNPVAQKYLRVGKEYMVEIYKAKD